METGGAAMFVLQFLDRTPRTRSHVARTDSGNLDPDAIRLFCADRPISDEVLARVTAC